MTRAVFRDEDVRPAALPSAEGLGGFEHDLRTADGVALVDRPERVPAASFLVFDDVIEAQDGGADPDEWPDDAPPEGRGAVFLADCQPVQRHALVDAIEDHQG